MRRIVLGIVLAAAVTGCRDAASPVAGPEPGLLVEGSPSPYTQVTAGAVTALVPDGWQPMIASGPREGFVASPRPLGWVSLDGAVEGMSVTWVDATRIGVPSDYYYLAARQPVLGHLMASGSCRAIRQRVIVDRTPAWMNGDRPSPGDFLARGEGICRFRGAPTRFAYFVAAPGLGPVHGLGIPQSGLYLVVAIVHESPRAHRILQRLLTETRFGGAGLADFVEAVRA